MVFFTDEQRMIQETVGKLAREKIAHLAGAADQAGRSSPEVLQLLKDNGLLKISLPERYGGIGADHTTIAAVIEEMAKVDASTAMIIFATQTLIMVLRKWGTEGQKESFFGRMSPGDKVNAFSLTEPNHGSESASIQTRAVLDRDSYVVNGTKIFVTNGDIADFVLLFVRTGEGERHKGLSALVVEKDMNGFSVGKHEDKVGLRGSDLAELVFQDARVPRENLVGEPGKAWHILTTTAADMRAYGPGAMAVGLAQGALDYAVSYARLRVQFGVPISRHQGIRFMLADMSIQIEAARSLLYRTTKFLDSDPPDRNKRSRLTSAAKCFASDVAMRVTVDAVQVLGATESSRTIPSKGR
ncbi:MAG: acyl-CoA dehydrogenase family protein [Pseudomonadota bacterium]